MFGGPGVPLWTAFTIGYHIVNDYRNHHPDVSWATLTSTSAATILTGSHYQPCPCPAHRDVDRNRRPVPHLTRRPAATAARKDCRCSVPHPVTAAGLSPRSCT